jgi:ADP-heptose:LPS heptosyltransferase
MNALKEIRHPVKENVTFASLVRPGMKICIAFPHGLGDVVMFRPTLFRLRRCYPDTVIHFKPRDSYPEFDDHVEGMEYDLVFWLDYYVATASCGQTKNDLCCIQELGIPLSIEDTPMAIGGFRSPWVGVGCTSIACPGQNTPTTHEAKELNDGIIEAGFIPLDTAMVSNGFKFERRSPMAVDLRKVPGTYSKLAGILERCHAFIGTISGAYHVAQSLLPGRTLMLCPRAGEWRRLYRNAPVHINMRDITKESIRDWLLSLPESP